VLTDSRPIIEFFTFEVHTAGQIYINCSATLYTQQVNHPDIALQTTLIFVVWVCSADILENSCVLLIDSPAAVVDCH